MGSTMRMTASRLASPHHGSQPNEYCVHQREKKLPANVGIDDHASDGITNGEEVTGQRSGMKV
jgi:hypothetical protein